MTGDMVADVARHLFAGRRVLVLSTSWPVAVAALEEVRAGLSATGLDSEVRVTRGAGALRITHAAGGVVTFRSRRQSVHGLSADVLVLDQVEPSPAELAQLMPVFAASRCHEVIR